MGLDTVVAGILHPLRNIAACDENLCTHPVLSNVSLYAIPAN